MRRPRNAGFYKSDGASLRVPRRRFTAPARLQCNWGAVAYAVRLVYSAVVAILAPIFRKLPAAVGWAERRQLGCRELMGQRKLSFGGLTCITWGPLARNSHVCAERKLRLPEPDRIRLIGTPKAGGADCGVERWLFPQKKESLVSIGVTDVNLGSAHNLVLGIKHFKTLFKVMNSPLLAWTRQNAATFDLQMCVADFQKCIHTGNH